MLALEPRTCWYNWQGPTRYLVLQVASVGAVTIYVGEGDSLNGPKKACLVYQYSHGGHGASRVKVRKYISGRSESGWTEILKLSKPVMDLSDARQRRFLQTTLISLYYWQHRSLVERGLAVPDFLNDPC